MYGVEYYVTTALQSIRYASFQKDMKCTHNLISDILYICNI